MTASGGKPRSDGSHQAGGRCPRATWITPRATPTRQKCWYFCPVQRSDWTDTCGLVGLCSAIGHPLGGWIVLPNPHPLPDASSFWPGLFIMILGTSSQACTGQVAGPDPPSRKHCFYMCLPLYACGQADALGAKNHSQKIQRDSNFAHDLPWCVETL